MALPFPNGGNFEARSSLLPHVLVANRPSIVPGTSASRSVSVRLLEPLSVVAEQGLISLECLPLAEIDEAALRRTSILAMSRSFAPEVTELMRRARAVGTKIVYDVDDWILDFPAYAPVTVTPASRAEVLEHLSLANAVTVPVDVLMARLAPYCRHGPVLIPSCFDPTRHAPEAQIPASARGEVNIVFSNMMALKLSKARAAVIAALADSLKSHAQARLHFFGDPILDISALPCVRCWGSLPYNDHKRLLSAGGFDFAINPLGGWEDEAEFHFNDAKSPIKYIEYGAFGIPGIYSAAPVYERVVQDQVTGLLVENEYTAWRKALDGLIQDPVRCQTLGQAARLDVLANHHMGIAVERWMKLVQSLLTPVGDRSDAGPRPGGGMPLMPETAPIRLVLVRHGEAAGNAAGAIGCRDDEPLTLQGRHQVLQLRRTLEREGLHGWTRAYVSPTKRTRQTAMALCPDVTPKVVPDLREVNTGELASLSWVEARARFPEFFSTYEHHGRAFPRGESYAHAQARSAAWLESALATARKGNTFLVVAHGGVLGLLLHHLLDLPLSSFPAFQLDNGCATVLELRSDAARRHAYISFCNLVPERLPQPSRQSLRG